MRMEETQSHQRKKRPTCWLDTVYSPGFGGEQKALDFYRVVMSMLTRVAKRKYRNTHVIVEIKKLCGEPPRIDRVMLLTAFHYVLAYEREMHAVISAEVAPEHRDFFENSFVYYLLLNATRLKNAIMQADTAYEIKQYLVNDTAKVWQAQDAADVAYRRREFEEWERAAILGLKSKRKGKKKCRKGASATTSKRATRKKGANSEASARKGEASRVKAAVASLSSAQKHGAGGTKRKMSFEGGDGQDGADEEGGSGGSLLDLENDMALLSVDGEQIDFENAPDEEIVSKLGISLSALWTPEERGSVVGPGDSESASAAFQGTEEERKIWEEEQSRARLKEQRTVQFLRTVVAPSYHVDELLNYGRIDCVDEIGVLENMMRKLRVLSAVHIEVAFHNFAFRIESRLTHLRGPLPSSYEPAPPKRKMQRPSHQNSANAAYGEELPNAAFDSRFAETTTSTPETDHFFPNSTFTDIKSHFDNSSCGFENELQEKEITTNVQNESGSFSTSYSLDSENRNTQYDNQNRNIKAADPPIQIPLTFF